MSPVALKTVVAGGVVYPAGAAVPEDVAEGITAPGVFARAEAVDAPSGEADEGQGEDSQPDESGDSTEDTADESGSTDEPEGEGDSVSPAVDYSDKAWTVKKLKEEISTRNSYREPDAQLSTDGKRADLVAVLTADDKA